MTSDNKAKRDFEAALDAFHNETLESFISRYARTDAEMRDTIAFLIRHREQLRDCEIEVLEVQSQELVAKLADAKRKILLEELSCFKDVLELHRRLIRENDQPRD